MQASARSRSRLRTHSVRTRSSSFRVLAAGGAALTFLLHFLASTHLEGSMGFDKEEHHNISDQHLKNIEVSDMGKKLDILFSSRSHTENSWVQERLDAGFRRLLMQGSLHRVSRVVKTIFFCFGDQCFGDRCGYTIIYIVYNPDL